MVKVKFEKCQTNQSLAELLRAFKVLICFGVPHENNALCSYFLNLHDFAFLKNFISILRDQCQENILFLRSILGVVYQGVLSGSLTLPRL